jgi:hypothetical protein
MMFDLNEPTGKPVAIHYIDSTQDFSVSEERKLPRSNKSGGACLTAFAFNQKQRDLVAIGDLSGRIHVVKLCWRMANRHVDEQTILDEIGNLSGEPQDV